jgi:hypothetical protein
MLNADFQVMEATGSKEIYMTDGIEMFRDMSVTVPPGVRRPLAGTCPEWWND